MQPSRTCCIAESQPLCDDRAALGPLDETWMSTSGLLSPLPAPARRVTKRLECLHRRRSPERRRELARGATSQFGLGVAAPWVCHAYAMREVSRATR